MDIGTLNVGIRLIRVDNVTVSILVWNFIRNRRVSVAIGVSEASWQTGEVKITGRSKEI